MSPQNNSGAILSRMLGCLKIMASNSRKRNHTIGLQNSRSESGIALNTVRLVGIQVTYTTHVI